MSPTSSFPPRVLVADDEPFIRTLLAEAFERRGCRVVTAGTGWDAEAALAGATFDVVLADRAMPGGGYARLAEAARGGAGGTPRLHLMTGCWDLDEGEPGADGLWRKPFDVDAAVTAIIARMPGARHAP